MDVRVIASTNQDIEAAVQRAQGNLSRAARLARVRNRNTLVSRPKRHGIAREG